MTETTETSVNDDAAAGPLRIDVWADIVCPWCYVGEARLRDAALRTGLPIELVVHAFELDPRQDRPERVLEMLSRKFGVPPEQAQQMDERVAALARAEGLPYVSDRVTANTFDAHRLIAAAAEAGLGLEVREAIQRGHFAGEVDLSSHDQLIAAAVSAGLDRDLAARVLDGEDYAASVLADESQARELGATGVPFTVVGGRLAIPGCVETEQYAQVIERVAADV
ncbi:DsbA family protein [Demequina sp. NBRC 110053]|uniref:DsbA family oxidoreductase n=1 Tax=Demequina sp. NBRC 110053 TaxID=1570342 RepID=UPI0013566C30|nr:DsbA family oxidoreductase [Demequina sp. NBRC 110053]